MLGQGAHRDCEVSVLRDLQKMTGHGPGQLVLAGSARAGRLDQMTFRGPYQHKEFCETCFEHFCNFSLCT